MSVRYRSVMKPRPDLPGPGLWRGVYSSIVDHPDFQRLSPEARLVLLVARLGTANNIASIFRFYPQVLEHQTGLTADQLETAIRQLESTPSRAPWPGR